MQVNFLKRFPATLDLMGLYTGSGVMDWRIVPSDSDSLFLTIYQYVWLGSLFIMLYISGNESVLERLDLWKSSFQYCMQLRSS